MRGMLLLNSMVTTGKDVHSKSVKTALLALLVEVLVAAAALAVASERAAASVVEVDMVVAVEVLEEAAIVEATQVEAIVALLPLLVSIVVLPPLHQTPLPTTLPLAASVARSSMSAT